MATWEELQAALIHINDHYHSPLGWRNKIDDPELLRKIINWQNHHVPGCHVPDELVSDLRGHYPDLFNVKSGEMTHPPAAPAPGSPPPPPPQPGLTSPDLAPPGPAKPDAKTPSPPGPVKAGQGGDGGKGSGTGGASTGTDSDGDGFSGRAADTVKQIDAALAKNRSDLNEADDKLADAILNATTSSETGKAKLRALQESLISQVKKIGPSLDTPAGQQQLAEFLQGKVSEISEVLKDNGLDSAAHAAVLDGLTERFAALSGTKSGTKGGEAGGPDGGKGGAGDQPAPTVGEAPGDLLGPGGLASDPLLSSLMPGMGALSSLPGMLGGMLPGAGGGGFGMPGGGMPLGDLDSSLGSAVRDARSAEDTGLKDPPTTGEQVSSKEGAQSPEAKPAGAQGGEGSGDKPAAGTGQVTPVSTPEQTPEGQAAADTVVKLPSGATAEAGSAALAKAGRAVLDGTPIDDAYRQTGVNLSPRGAPVTAPVSPSKLVFGDIGQFTDHRIMALGDNRVWVNGREIALNELQTGPNFLGWERPVVPASQSAPVLKTAATASAVAPH